MSIQIIERNGEPEWAIVPYEDFLKLIEQAEMLQDVESYDSVKTALASGEEELIPSSVVYAILDGANPIQVWRDHRGLAQHELAEKAGISPAYLSQLETGKRRGSLEVLSAIARALNVSLEDVVPL